MKRYPRWAVCAMACLCLLAASCSKSPQTPPNPLSGARWYTETAFWTFFSDGTFETRNQVSNEVQTEGTYAFAADGTGTLQCGGESASITFSDDRSTLRLAYRSGDTVVLLRSNPYQPPMTDNELMELLWVGDYENPDATITISYCTQDKSVSYAIMAKSKLFAGVLHAEDPSLHVVRDDRYTVTLLEKTTISIAVNPGYEDSDAAQYAGIYRRYR